ncbi:hypothetical protein LDK15_08935 [Fusobacterium nucleatum]|uniref:hypothetical protein n=1 Tax=Fusobacterium nucleatum TaxID=851 RepID=UPI0030D07F94
MIKQNNINEYRLTMLKLDIEYNKREQIFVFILLFTMIIGGFVLVYIGREVGGYGAIIGSITIVIASVIWNKQKNKDKS